MTVVKNKIPDVSNMTKKDVKISDIESKLFTRDDYNKCTGQTLDANIKQKGLIEKSEISGFINNAGLDKKNSSNISNKIWIKSRARQNNKITSIWHKLFSR